jgi:hypothetical protein
VRGNGRGAFLYVEGLYDRTITPGEMYRLRAEWNALSIVSHVGIAADSISSFAILLERKNQEFPLLSRHNETEKAEKMLVSIAEASSHFSEGALNELNRAAGSRLFEHPAPAVPVAFAGGAIPAGLMAVPLPFHHRDITALIAHYREQWRAAMGPNGPLTAAPADQDGGQAAVDPVLAVIRLMSLTPRQPTARISMTHDMIMICHDGSRTCVSVYMLCVFVYHV